MATLSTRPNRKGVYVYYTDPSSGKAMQLPRSMTKHLDGLPIEQQTAWIEKWEKDHGIGRQRSTRMHLHENDLLTTHWKNYQSNWDSRKDRRDTTRNDEDQVWESKILPFFVGKHYKKDPRDWHSLIPAFHAEIFGSGLGKQSICKTLHALERFGKYLVFAQVMTFPFAIQAPKVKVAQITPLKVKLSPEDIIRHAMKVIPEEWSYAEKVGGIRETITPDELRLSLLLAYFAGLSPSELFAVEKEDFLTGATSEELCKTLASFRVHKFGTKLSVVIDKTLPKKGKKAVYLTKNDYRTAVVNIWHQEAAKLIVELLKARPKGRLVPLAKFGMFKAWRKHVLPKLGATFHDLRRSSCLYLGRTVRLPATLIQEHMRHANLSTTMLYMREPKTPDRIKKVKQDFDDI